MRVRLWTVGAVAVLLVLTFVASADAATGPRYDIKATWGTTNLTPGDNDSSTAEGQFVLQARNLGDAVGGSDLTIEDELPAGLTVTAITWSEQNADYSAGCSGVGTGVATCVMPAAKLPVGARPAGHKSEGPVLTPSGYLPTIYVDVSVPGSAGGMGTDVARIYGGGGSLPDGSPCAQLQAELATLPPCGADEDRVPFDKSPAAFGLVPGGFLSDFFDAAYPVGAPTRRASDRPFELRTDFDITARTGVNDGSSGGDTSRYVTPTGQLRTVEVTLPRGFLGNPEAVPKCDLVDFSQSGASGISTTCPSDTQVGYLNISFAEGTTNHGHGGAVNANSLLSRIPLYNLVPPKGQLADLAFNGAGIVQGHIYPTLDPAHHYAIKTVSPDISALVQVRGVEVTVWGVPGDPAHDRFRFFPGPLDADQAVGAPWGSAPIRPFLTNPMDCGEDNGGTSIRMDSYEHPGQFSPAVETDDHLNVTGCDDPRFRFEPEVTMQPSGRDAGGPTGLDVDLKIPQRNDEVDAAAKLYAENGNVKAIATPPMKKVVVTLPQGMTVSPSAAQGLEACTPAQLGIDPRTWVPNDAPSECPEASQYGTIRLKSPALPQNKTITGHLYVAQPYDNPFGSFLALYFVIDDEDLGLRLKLPGEVKLDPATGQITTVFDDLPQLPASEAEVKVKGGLRAGLVNPQTCGKKTITATFYSWHDRDTPNPVTDSYEIAQGPGGTRCFDNPSERSFDPQLEAGTTNPLAGAFAPLEIDLTRTDAEQDLSAVSGTAPPGLLASIRGMTRCSDAQIAAASNPLHTGVEELNNPSCPASSQVGTVDAGAGVGQILTFVKGKLYIAGPYKGAPLSGVAIVPAVAGPFDLGTVVTRAPAYIDPITAQLRVVTDPLPLIFKGVPVRVRDIRVHLDKPDFTLNPTSCEAMSIEADLQSAEGRRKHASNRFQVGSCAELGFKPKLSIKLLGGTRRAAHPSLRAELKPRPGDANIASASATLPHSAFLDQAHIRTICTRVQFAADQCPAGSVYGHAVAYTPLLDEPLEGPVYLRSSSHNLPDLVVALKGPPSLPVSFDLDGRVDSVGGGIRASFEATPDAPVSRFVLTMQGGKKGLVINSKDLCASTNRARVTFVAHSGKHSTSRPEVLPAGCARKGAKHKPEH